MLWSIWVSFSISLVCFMLQSHLDALGTSAPSSVMSCTQGQRLPGSGVRNTDCSALLLAKYLYLCEVWSCDQPFPPARVGDSFCKCMVAKGVPWCCSTVSLQPLERWCPAWLAKRESCSCWRNPLAFSLCACLISHDPEQPWLNAIWG